MSVYDPQKTLIFTGGTIATGGVTTGDLLAEQEAREQADEGGSFYISTKTDSTDIKAYLDSSGELVLGWDQLLVQTPFGTRSIAERMPAVLPSGQMLYIDLLSAYDGVEYPVLQAQAVSARFAEQSRGEILILAQRQTGRVVGNLDGEIQRRLDLAAPNALVGYQSIATNHLHTSEPNWATGRQPKVIPHTGWFILQPGFLGAKYRFTQSTVVVDLDHYPIGAECMIEIPAGGKMFSATGFDGETGNELSFSTVAYAKLYKMAVSGPVIVELLGGSAPTAATITKPAMDRTILLVGQSQLHLGHQQGRVGGFAEEMATGAISGTASNESFHILNTAVSGSAMDSRSTGGSNYWWDAGLAAPGPLLDDAVAAIAASTASGQPAPTVVLFAQGEGDTQAIDQGTITDGDWQNAVSQVATHIRNNGAANSDWLMFPPGANDAAFYFEGMNGIRTKYRALTDGVAYMHYGHEMYDLDRVFRNLHPTDMGYYTLGIRDALVYQSVIDAVSVDLGPAVTVANIDATGTVVTVQIDGGQEIWGPNQTYESGPYPFGMHIMSGNAVTGNHIPIISGKLVIAGAGGGNSATVTLYTAADATGADVYTIPGQYPDVWRRGYLRDRVLHGNSLGLPLRFQRVAIT